MFKAFKWGKTRRKAFSSSQRRGVRYFSAHVAIDKYVKKKKTEVFNLMSMQT